MYEFANEKIRGLNGSKIIRQDKTKYRSHNFFTVNPHVRMLSQLFQKSAYLTQFKEMLFLSLQQIYLRTSQILTVLQWMQPPIICNSTKKRDQQYLKIIQYAQQTRQLGIVPEQIYIIEIERLLKVIQNDNKEITLKILYELCVSMNCIIRGKQEFVLYDKFFAYLYHQFNSGSDFVLQSIQQREYIKKSKEEQRLSKLNQHGLRRVGQISTLKNEFYLEEQQSDGISSNPQLLTIDSNLKLPNSRLQSGKLSQQVQNAELAMQDLQKEIKDYYNMYAEYFYDSVKNLIQFKGGNESLNYKFLGLKFSMKDILTLNAVYQHEEFATKLYLHPYQLVPLLNEKQNTLTKYLTYQSMLNNNNNKEDQVENLQEFLRQSPPLSPQQSNINIKTETIHQQTHSNEDIRVEYEDGIQNEYDNEFDVLLDFTLFDPQTTVQYQVYSVNSECVAGIKITFPEEQSSFRLIQFPCIEPQEGGYDCHTYQFKPLSNIKGCQVELIQMTPSKRFIKNFIFLVQDSENALDQNKLKYFKFDFQKNQEMGDIQNLHDQIMPYFNDDWRKSKFPLYVNFLFSHLPQAQQIQIEAQLKKITYAINTMFPYIEYLENKKKLINPNVFEMYVQELGRYKNRDQYQRTVFIQIENWQQILQDRIIDNILDNIIIFIWNGGFDNRKLK
ncbi:unnamed protein product [Paramecium sonneborni]|uniref:Uncharacterized protein n=1 Tax=Paramecium sonneborni TaxID=65129 RepID=A0A8S1LI46_9CILI|nr:unnamed protein product [Paramecium sonneborni]